MLRAEGARAVEFFEREAGGHRWQRVPPTEKRGRVHTSTITVAVLEEPDPRDVVIDRRDLDETFTRGSGPGGQHRNKTETAVILRHAPSGLQVRVDGGRSRETNRQNALALLRAKLRTQAKRDHLSTRNRRRKQQVGSGMRGDKIRTVQVKNGVVVDHRSGKRTPYRRYMRGDLSDLR